MKVFINTNQKILVFVAVILVSLLSVRSAIHEASILGGSSDEFVNLSAMINFVQSGKFVNTSIHGLAQTQEPFSPYISTGPIAMIPGVIGWSYHQTILYSRIACCVFAFLSVFGFFLFYSRKLFSLEIALSLSAAAWSLFLLIPEWTFIKSLGELTGIVWLLFGIAFLLEKKPIGFLFFGVAVWLCKITYLPAAGIFLLILSLTRHTSFLKNLGYFILPLFIWISWIFICTDSIYILKWFEDFSIFLIEGPKGVKQEFLELTILQRVLLDAPRWTIYYKLVFYILLSASIFNVVKMIAQRKIKQEIVLFSALLSSLFYFFWSLFLTVIMWQRHSQPGMYLSLSVVLFLLFKKLKQSELKQKQFAFTSLGITFLVFLIVGYNNTSFSKVLFTETYVRYPLNNFKGIFRNSNIYSEEYRKSSELFSKISYLKCDQLFGKKFKINTVDSKSETPIQRICFEENPPIKLPLYWKEGGKEIQIKGYNFYAPSLVPNTQHSVVAKIYYDFSEPDRPLESSYFKIHLNIDLDENLEIKSCSIKDYRELSNFMIIKTGNIFDVCNPSLQY